LICNGDNNNGNVVSSSPGIDTVW